MKKQQTEHDSVSEPAFWDACYANEQTGWDRGAVHPALQYWLRTDQLLRCNIAIPGCGNGHEVVVLAQNGFEVTAIDFAKEPLKHLRNKLRGFESNSNVIHGDVFDFTPANKFDAVYEQTCLCAIAPAQRAAYERQLFKWLKKSGMLYVLFMQTEREKVAPPFHCGLEEMKLLFDESRWEWTDETMTQYPHPSGKIFELAAILKQKGTPNVS